MNWQSLTKEGASKIRFGATKTETRDDQHHFEIEIENLDSSAFKVELFANRETIPMEQRADGRYFATVPATRPVEDFTVRVIPFFPDASIPLENSQIIWQR